MTLYQITYVNGQASYSLVPIKKKNDSSKQESSPSGKELCCEECGLKFATEIRLRYHRSTHKPLQKKNQQLQHQQVEEDPLKFEKTTRRSKPKSNIEQHDFHKEVRGQKIQKNLTFYCPSCEYSTSNRTMMIEHFTGSHCVQQQTEFKQETDDAGEEEIEASYEEEQETIEEEPEVPIEQLVCEQCGFVGYTQDDIDFHTCEPESKSETYTCHLCTYECPTSMGLQSHITRKHKPKPIVGQPRVYECSKCDFKSEKKSVIYAHRKRHKMGADMTEPECSYYCNECNFSTRAKSALYLHIRRRHKTGEETDQPLKQVRPELYQCDQCNYTNKNKYDVKVHVIRKHTNDYNHACEICGKKYKIKGDLTNHIRFQHREQPIICDVCGKTCGNSNSLYVHQKFAHYKAEFECPICHRRMVSQANLDEHILKQHEQREDAVCDECGKRFSRQSRLKIHMRVHTGLKPHTCKICGKSFSRKTALRQHLLIHTGQRPYVCDICGKAFTQKPGLISHRKSHPGSHPPLPRVTIDHVLSEFFNEEEA